MKQHGRLSVFLRGGLGNGFRQSQLLLPQLKHGICIVVARQRRAKLSELTAFSSSSTWSSTPSSRKASFTFVMTSSITDLYTLLWKIIDVEALYMHFKIPYSPINPNSLRTVAKTQATRPPARLISGRPNNDKKCGQTSYSQKCLLYVKFTCVVPCFSDFLFVSDGVTSPLPLLLMRRPAKVIWKYG